MTEQTEYPFPIVTATWQQPELTFFEESEIRRAALRLEHEKSSLPHTDSGGQSFYKVTQGNFGVLIFMCEDGQQPFYMGKYTDVIATLTHCADDESAAIVRGAAPNSTDGVKNNGHANLARAYRLIREGVRALLNNPQPAASAPVPAAPAPIK
jgi:hypothetical protein